MSRGVVLSGSNNSFVVRGEDGAIARCGLKGKKLKGAEGFYNPLAAGDVVEWEPASAGLGTISSLVPRRSLFWRYNEKGKAIQAIAANMDTVVCVTSAGLPPFRPRFIDRVSLEPVSEGIGFAIVLNKADLGVPEDVEERMADYRRLGFITMAVSAATGEGVDALKRLLAGKTSVFVGQSGVGKSSLLNAVEDGLGLRVGEVCEKYERGRHTTVSAVLVRLSDGVSEAIDTPGFRRLAVRGIDPMSLGACFPEIKAAQAGCALGPRCRHLDEPGCAVVEAVEAGAIHEDRYESYARILSELVETKEYARKAGRRRVEGAEDYDDA